jgi:hypothetical protein
MSEVGSLTTAAQEPQAARRRKRRRGRCGTGVGMANENSGGKQEEGFAFAKWDAWFLVPRCVFPVASPAVFLWSCRRAS